MTTRVLILVEGQTEERFVKDVLSPAFLDQQIYFFPTLLVTKRVKSGTSFKGGVTNYGKFVNDAKRLLQNCGTAVVTTLIDYYGLPEDCPGMDTRPNGSPADRVAHVEAAIRQDLGNPPNFIPFLTLHEFEALLFSAHSVLPRVMTHPELEDQFAAIRRSVGTPEDINERPEYAPSKRIERLFPGYKKALHGPIAAGRIGLDRIRAECPHFRSWLGNLEAWANH